MKYQLNKRQTRSFWQTIGFAFSGLLCFLVGGVIGAVLAANLMVDVQLASQPVAAPLAASVNPQYNTVQGSSYNPQPVATTEIQ